MTLWLFTLTAALAYGPGGAALAIFAIALIALVRDLYRRLFP